MKSLENKRWFIWTLVIIVVCFVSLYAYIAYSYTYDDTAPTDGWIVHRQKKPSGQDKRPAKTLVPQRTGGTAQ